MSSDVHARLQVAKQAAYISGDELIRQFGGEWRALDRVQGLKRAEDESLKALRLFISQIFPADEIWARGGGDTPKGKNFWVVNPLGGQHNFVSGDDGYTTTVSWVESGTPVAAAVSVPAQRKLFSAATGKGAIFHTSAIHVSSTDNLEQASLFVDLGNEPEARSKAIAALQQLESSTPQLKNRDVPALEICAIAQGTDDGFIGYDLEPWDWVAAKLILEEAGGQLTDIEGQPMKLSSHAVIASNGTLHNAILKALGK